MARTSKPSVKPVALLSGGNPQIPTADGDAPVQAYIAAMPGWKRGVGERLDALIVRTVPKVRKAVKWNSPFYGIEGRGWFLSFHVFTRYVWRTETLARMRALILETDPAMTEEWKGKKPTNPLGVPVWSHDGIVCTGETYAKAVKLTFAHGASLADPARLFNASLDGGTRRAIDIREGDEIDARAFTTLVKAAVAHNRQTAKKRR